MREFLATIGERATLLRGRCLNYGDGITYWALGELLRGAAGVEEADDPDAVRAKLGRWSPPTAMRHEWPGSLPAC